MSSIGYTHHLKCRWEKCKKRRPYWSDFCKEHREELVKAPSKKARMAANEIISQHIPMVQNPVDLRDDIADIIDSKFT